MSLLDRGTEQLTVYPEVTTTDPDGNPITKADTANPVLAWGRVQRQGQSGTSARRAEVQQEGHETEEVYIVRFVRGTQLFGAQSKLLWRGKVYSFFGDVDVRSSSPKTAHELYTVRRS